MRIVILGPFLRAMLALLLLGAAALGAEEPRPWPSQDAIQTWRVGSGLPHQRVQAVCQTGDGFLWVGTAQGLVRFDGVKFERAGLPGNPSVVRLAAGKNNRLWVGTEDGTLWRGEGMRFEKIFEDRFPGGFEILAEDRDGRLWISSIVHFRVYLWEKGELRDMTGHWDHANAGHVSQMRLDEDGRPVANGSGMIWTVEGETLKPVPGYQGGSVYHAPGRGTSYWVSDGQGVRRLTDGQLSAPVGPANWGGRNLTFGIEDHDGNLWLATGGFGIVCYRDKGSSRRLDTRDGLCGDFASCLYVDRQGNLWVGSDGGGLSRVTPALFGVAGRVQGLSSDRVTAIEKGPGGSLWIGTHADGLNRFDGRTFSRVAGFPETTGVLALTEDGNDLWVGTASGLFLGRDNKLQRMGGWPRAGAAVTAQHRDRSGVLWIGQRSAGTIMRVQANQVGEIRLRADAQPEFDVRDFAEDGAGRVWIATDGAGLFNCLDGKVESVGDFQQVTALESAGDFLWVAADGGLARVKQAEGAWHLEPGWAKGHLRTLRSDERGGLWATDDLGLCRLDVSTFPAQLTRFGEADGVPGLQGASSGNPQSVRGDDGRLWFATTAGVATVEPSRFAPEAKAPPVLLEELRVNGQARWSRGDAAEPVFQSGDRGFDFRFTAIDLRHPEMLDFAARIDGVDEDWKNIGNTHSVFHATLPAGQHRFRVKVRDRSGTWSEEQALAFEVLPPLWQRGWFVMLVSLAGVMTAAGIAWLVTRWRLQRQLEALRVERALEAERSRIARDLHDQLGSGLTDIAFLGDALRMDSDSAEAAEVSVRARELTRAMDETVWALNPEKDNFQSLISYLGHAVPGWLRPTGIHCRLDLPDESVRFGLSTRVRQQLFLACKEAIHNAVKHSGAGLVSLRIERAGGELVITLSDDGHGFDPATAKVGHGLANLRHRLQDLGGSARIDSAPGCGTTVVFRLPLPSTP